MAWPAIADIRGLVLSARGEPIPTITVTAYQPESDSAATARILARIRRPAIASATTERNGAFNFSLQTNGQVELVVRDLRFVPFKQYFDTTDDAVSIVLENAVVVHGKVTARGQPVDGASIVISDYRGVLWEARTATDGSFPLPDPSSWASTIWFFHPTLGATTRWFSQGAPLVFHMDHTTAVMQTERAVSDVIETPTITGRIVDENQKPLSGVIVATGRDNKAVSDRYGRYTIANLAHDKYTIWFDSENAFAAQSAEIDLRTTETARHDFIARRFRLARGSVTDYDGMPLSATRIDAWSDKQSEAFKPTPRSTVTTGDGRFQVRFAAFDGELMIHATPPALPRTSVGPFPIGPAGRTGIRVVVAKGSEITGTIIDDGGNPIAGVSVDIAPSGPRDVGDATTTTSDVRGRFAARVTRDVLLELQKKGFVTKRDRVTLPAQPLQFVMTRAVEITGRVVRPNGAPFKEAMVGLLSTRLIWTRANDNGEFVLKGIAPGEYKIAAMSEPGQIRQQERGGLPKEQQAITAPASEIVLTAVDDVVDARGTVVDAATGNPIESFVIVPIGMNLFAPYVHTQGRFALTMPSGEMTWFIGADGYLNASRIVNIERGKSLLIKLTRGRSIRGRSRDSAGKGIGGVRVGDFRVHGVIDPRVLQLGVLDLSGAESAEDGSFELRGVVFDEVTLAFAKNGYATTRRTIQAGQADVEIYMQLSR